MQISRAAVPFDGQTIWRIITFFYTGQYSDDDADLSRFGKVAPPSLALASIDLGGDLPSDEMDLLAHGFRQLQVTPRSCRATVFLRAWANMQVYVAATGWDIDRLIVASSERFDHLLRGASSEAGFSDFVEAIFKYVSDPGQLLYSSIAQECALHIEDLIHDHDFLSALQRNPLLGRLIIERLVGRSELLRSLFARVCPNDSQALVPASSASSPTSPLSDAGTNDRSLQTDNAAALRLQNRELLSENRKLGAEAKKQKAVLEQKDNKIDKLENDLDDVEAEMVVLEEDVKKQARLNKELTSQINSQRSGQPQNTDFMIQLRESRLERDAMQRRLAVSEAETQKLKDELAAKVKAIARNKSPAPVQSGEAAARRVNGFGSVGGSVQGITTGNVVASVAPHFADSAALLARQTRAINQTIAPVVSGGPKTFAEAQMARMRAAGIHTPPGMTLVSRASADDSQQPSATAPSLTNCTAVNGTAHLNGTGHANGQAQVNGSSPYIRQTPSPTAATSNGTAHATSPQRTNSDADFAQLQKELQRERANAAFLQRQLNDLRTGKSDV